MSNKIEVSDWQLQSFVKKLENHLTNGWEVDDSGVAYFDGLRFHASLVQSETVPSPAIFVEEATAAGSPVGAVSSDVEGEEVVLDQKDVETPVTAQKEASRKPSVAKKA